MEQFFSLHHRGMDCIGVRLSREDSRNALVRKIPGIKWSQTHCCWYAQDSADLKKQFSEIFGKIFSIQNTSNESSFADFVSSSAGPNVDPEDTELFTPDMEQLLALKTFKRHMQVKRYAENSIINYEKAILKFMKFFQDRNWRDLNAEDICIFQQAEIIDKRHSQSYQNILINAIKLFYEVNTGFRPDTSFISRPRQSHYLPTILSREDLEKLLKAVGNKKHKTMLSLCYACGLRSGELLRLQCSHIHRHRKILMIKSGKGNKDRQVPVSDKVMEMLDEYYKDYRPATWLFEGQVKGEPYSMRSLQLVLKKSLQKARLSPKITLHCLRHTFATHLIESGVHIRMVQELLGHKSIRTTEIYTHVSHSMMNRLKNPFDDLNL